MPFELDRNRIDKVPTDMIVAELKRVAEFYGFREFTGREFDKVTVECKKTTVMNAFESWPKALAATGFELKPRTISRKDQIPEEQLFSELERIWRLLEHRPSRNEWEVSQPKFSYTTYKHRFGGWVNACARFIDFRSGGALLDEDDIVEDETVGASVQPIEIPSSRKRHIPLGLRLEVLKRDNFKCVYCGRSPALEVGVVLHIDHIFPFSKGGETILVNLQCLCEDCNLGKSSK